LTASLIIYAKISFEFTRFITGFSFGKQAMEKNKQISLLLLIGTAVAVAAAMAVSPDNRQIWHLFELLAIVSALVFALPGAIVVSIAAIGVGLAYLPGEPDMLFAYARLLVAASLVGWYVAEQGSRRAALNRLVMVDRQTGLRAYSYFMDRLTEECKRADRFGSRLSLIVLNLDHFKSAGAQAEPAEDNLLNDLAQTVKTAVRQVDIVSRYGGEEFAVLLPNTGRAAAEEIAERIRQAVEDAELSGGGVNKITISAGLATYPDHADDELELVDRAEAALMQAVDAGRNRVMAFNLKENATPVAN
jgi:two-component system, cell cycle response regulator